MFIAICSGEDTSWVPEGATQHTCIVDDVSCVCAVSADGPTLYRAAMLAGTPRSRPYLAYGPKDEIVNERLNGVPPDLTLVNKDLLEQLSAESKGTKVEALVTSLASEAR
jgi:hypothetical protein